MSYIQNNNQPSHISQQKLQKEARIKAYNLLAHQTTAAERSTFNLSILKNLSPFKRAKLNHIITQCLTFEVNYESQESIANGDVRRGTMNQWIKEFVKFGLIRKIYRHRMTCIYQVDPYLFADREYYYQYLPSLKSLTYLLLISSLSEYRTPIKCFSNTRSVSANIFKKTVNRTVGSNGQVHHTQEGVVMTTIPKWLFSLEGVLTLTPAGYIELSGFSEVDIAYGKAELIRHLRKHKSYPAEPFKWFLTVCRRNATEGKRRIDWMMVSKMKAIAGYDGNEDKYIPTEYRELEQSSPSMINSNNKSSIKGKSKDAAYQAYVPEERKPDEDSFVAAFKVAANCVEKNSCYGNPWYNAMTLEQQAALHQKYPTYAKLAGVQPVVITDAVSNLTQDESLLSQQLTYLNIEEEPLFEEITDIVSGMANFRSSSFDVDNLPMYQPETDEMDELLKAYNPGREKSSHTSFKSVGNILESVLRT